MNAHFRRQASFWREQKNPQSGRAQVSRLHHSQCALGAYYRRMAARLGKGKAITATAHKLAHLFYSLL